MLRRRINNKQSMAYEQNAVSFRCINMKLKLQYYTVDGRSVEVLMGNDVCPHDMFVVYLRVYSIQYIIHLYKWKDVK